CKEVFVEKDVADKEVSATGEVNVASIATTVSAVVTITTEEIFLAQALKSQDKGKAIMIEELVKPKKKDQIKLDEEAALRVNTFVEFKTELVEGSSKRAGEELTQECAKKQKVDDDKETTYLKQLMKIIPDEKEIAIDAIPLSVKSPRIVDWKIHKEGKIAITK
nr:hypothetical protein [Tanacetum cinerariifolium]